MSGSPRPAMASIVQDEGLFEGEAAVDRATGSHSRSRETTSSAGDRAQVRLQTRLRPEIGHCGEALHSRIDHRGDDFVDRRLIVDVEAQTDEIFIGAELCPRSSDMGRALEVLFESTC